MTDTFEELTQRVKNCSLCQDQLPLGPRPVFQLNPEATLLIAGQAPGSRVHKTGIPFNDPSGDRLRQWLGITSETFYDPTKVAILPMGFCYPGKGKSGDLPPIPLCASTWRSQLLAALPNVQLTLPIGLYAQTWHLSNAKKTLTETVKSWQEYDHILPLPHPSPRNNIWLKKNPWFEESLLPALKIKVKKALA